MTSVKLYFLFCMFDIAYSVLRTRFMPNAHPSCVRPAFNRTLWDNPSDLYQCA